MLQTLRLCQIHYWRHRWRLRLLAAHILIVGLALWFGAEHWPPTTVVLLALSIVIPLTLFALAIFSFAQELDLTQPDSAFPRWWFALPIATWRLAIVPIALLALTLLLQWYIAWRTVPGAMNAGAVWVAFLWVALGGASWLQWVSWQPVPHPLVRLAALPLLAALAVGAEALLLGLDSAALRTLVGIAYFASGAGAAVHAAGSARNRGTIRARALSELSWFDRKVGGSMPRLSTPAAALRWRDRRQVTRLFPPMCCGIALLALLLPTPVPSVIGAVLILSVPAFMAITLGNGFGKASALHGSSRMPGYLSILPVTNWQMTRIRFGVIIASAVQAWALTLPWLAIWCAIHGRHLLADAENQLRTYGLDHPWWVYAAALLSISLLLTMSLATSSAWITAAGRVWLETTVGCAGSVLFLVGLLVALKNFAAVASPQELHSMMQQWQRLVPIYLLGLAAAKAALFVSLGAYVVRRGIVPASAIGCLGGFLLLIPWIATLLLNLLLPNGPGDNLERWAIVTLLTPAASIPMFAAMLDWNRHR